MQECVIYNTFLVITAMVQ